jgi:hypothetical protein
MAQTTLITGNTFPVKDQLRALGGRWDADEKGWRVPADKADEARQLVAGAGPKSPAPARAGGYSGFYGGRGRRACKTGGNCSSFGSGRSCGGHDCDGY